MKKILLFLLAVAAVHGVSWGQVTDDDQTGDLGGFYLTYQVSGDECEVTYINITANATASNPLTVAIPETIEGKTVTYVRASEFSASGNGSWKGNSIILVLKNLPGFNDEFTDVEALKEIVVKGTVPDGVSDFNWFYQVDDKEVITTVSEEYQDQEDVSLRYVRELSETWQPLFVPFSADWTDMGVQIAELSRAETTADGGEVLHWTTVTETEANRPYIIRRTGNDELSQIELDDDEPNPIELEDATVTLPTSLRIDEDEDGDALFAVNSKAYTYQLHGTYKEIRYADRSSNDEDDDDFVYGDWYAMYNGNFHKAASGAKLHPQRFYLTISEVGSTQTCPAPQGGIRVMVDDEVVGIIEHIFEPELLIDDNYYDVLGRRIDNPQPGCLYIHQGKKIIYSDQPTTDY